MNATIIPFPTARAQAKPAQTPVPNKNGVSSELIAQAAQRMSARLAYLQEHPEECPPQREEASMARLERMILERIAKHRSEKSD